MKKILAFLGIFIGIILILFFTKFPWWIEPSNDRVWNQDQVVLPEISRNGDEVSIKNIRNFTYTSATDFTAGYYNATYNVKELETVDFLVEPFNGVRGAAHTLVSFGFKDGRYLAISIEIRKEPGESFSPWKGMAKEYELMYVIADEKDVIKLRSNYRHDQVYLYPIKTTPAKAQALFESMLARSQKLSTEPEFYHTIFSNCTTNLASHVNEITPNLIPWSFTQVLPANADQTLYELGLINTNLPFEQARAKYHINDRAEKYANDPYFSHKIRE